MKKYLTKWVFIIDPGKSPARANAICAHVGLAKPSEPNGTVSYERMMVADEAWVRQNMGDIDLEGFELPELFTTELFGEKEE